MQFKDFQDGRRGSRNGTILAILNLYVASRMPPIKFRLNPTYGLESEVVCKISR